MQPLWLIPPPLCTSWFLRAQVADSPVTTEHPFSRAAFFPLPLQHISTFIRSDRLIVSYAFTRSGVFWIDLVLLSGKGSGSSWRCRFEVCTCSCAFFNRLWHSRKTIQIGVVIVTGLQAQTDPVTVNAFRGLNCWVGDWDGLQKTQQQDDSSHPFILSISSIYSHKYSTPCIHLCLTTHAQMISTKLTHGALTHVHYIFCLFAQRPAPAP